MSVISSRRLVVMVAALSLLVALSLTLLSLGDKQPPQANGARGSVLAPDGARIPEELTPIASGKGWNQFAWANGNHLCTQIKRSGEGGGGGYVCGEPDTVVPWFAIESVNGVVVGIVSQDVSMIQFEDITGERIDAVLIECPCPGFDRRVGVFAADVSAVAGRQFVKFVAVGKGGEILSTVRLSVGAPLFDWGDPSPRPAYVE